MLKQYITVCLAMFAISNTIKAQSLILTCESGNRAIETANCWAFGAMGYTNVNNQTIIGTWSLRGNAATNLNPTACWAKTPWMLIGNGNITLKAKIEPPINGTIRRVIVSYIPFEATATNSSKEGNLVRFDSTDLQINANVNNLSYTIPAAIRNSAVPYKIMFSFVGTGGSSRFNADDLSIPGTYAADPANGCLPKATRPDADGDGVIDAEDAFPNDATRAYSSIFPTKEHGTYMFEDTWPQTGDYDFNDVVLGYKYTTITNASNNVVELKGEIIVRAVGAEFKNGFGIQLDNLRPTTVSSVVGTKTINPFWLSNAANGTENGQDFVNVIVIDDVTRVMGGRGFINTELGSSFINPDTTRFTISFTTTSNIKASDIAINPYIIINQDRTREIHLADRMPTNKINRTFLGTVEDNSNAATGIYYKTKRNLPWALNVTSNIPYAIEKRDITTAYLLLVKWAASNGIEAADWYLDLSGYRNTNNIYRR
jgi:LruC domain-containing protein